MEIINPTDCPYYLVSRVTLVATSALKRALASAGVKQVKPAYLGVLLSLWREDGLKVNTLGQKAGLEPSTMTGLIDRMERDNLVTRLANPDDRRVQHIHLTELGRKIKKPALKVVDEAMPKVFKGISNKDLSHVKKILHQILINTQKVEI